MHIKRINEMSNANTRSEKNICKNKFLDILVSENNLNIEYFYHATPSCYVNSIKKYGLGAKFPKKRLWDYKGTEYENIKRGVFLATDEYVAESYVETSEYFEDLSDEYEERYDKELEIVVFKIKKSNLNPSLLHVDTNQKCDDESEQTFFYDGVIPYNMLEIIDLYQ